MRAATPWAWPVHAAPPSGTGRIRGMRPRAGRPITRSPGSLLFLMAARPTQKPFRSRRLRPIRTPGGRSLAARKRVPGLRREAVASGRPGIAGRGMSVSARAPSPGDISSGAIRTGAEADPVGREVLAGPRDRSLMGLGGLVEGGSACVGYDLRWRRAGVASKSIVDHPK